MRRFRPSLLGVTVCLFVVLFVTAALLYRGFGSLRVVSALFSDNAVVGIAALGEGLVILTGGLELSVGAVVGAVSIVTATLIERHGVSAYVAWSLALAGGTAFGAALGCLIPVFRMPAFLVTLAGMFLARGIGFWVDTESVGITSPLYSRVSDFGMDLLGLRLTTSGLALIAVTAGAYLIAHRTRFGRTLVAIGGSESSALLMGLPVAATKVAIYALCGFSAALAGIVGTLYTGSGNPSSGVGLELDAIAIVVIGGTLLSGGRGHVLGTFFGLLIFGTIQSAILFDGRLSSWWIRIVVGALLLVFITVQRLFVSRMARR